MSENEKKLFKDYFDVNLFARLGRRRKPAHSAAGQRRHPPPAALGRLADPVHPGPTLALLEKLKDDPSEYVRRSVSNHLNDIAKDHPRLVVEQMSFSLQSTVVTGQNLVIDFVIHFVKANGQTSGKVFKLKTAVLLPNEALAVTKSHPIRPITTRTYHPGTHRVQIQVNGQIVGERSFELVLP